MRPSDEKALKLVIDGCVTVTWVGDGAASGIVDGYTGTYQVSYSPAGKVCTCQAGVNHRKCSHATALELEVLRQSEGVKV